MNIYYNILSIFSNNYVSFFPSSYVFECKENANKSKGVSTNRFSDLPLKKKKLVQSSYRNLTLLKLKVINALQLRSQQTNNSILL